MKRVTGCAQAARDETGERAGAREVGRRHLADRPDDDGERQNGDEWNRYQALEPFIAESCYFPMRTRCEREANDDKEHDGDKWQGNQSDRRSSFSARAGKSD